MSWNESGGPRDGGPRNPWERKRDGGPVDLDSLVRDLQRKLRQWFGQRGGGTGPGGSGERTPPSAARFGLVGLGLVLVWLATGFYQVGAAERVIITRFGRFTGISAPGGVQWHWPWPIEAKQVVNTQEVQSYTEHTRMLTQDEALVEINAAVQYRRSDPYAFTFKVVEPDETLAFVAESAIREVMGQHPLEYVLERGRQDISLKTKALIQRTLDSYQTGLEILSVNLQDVGVPEQVSSSQKDAIKAREDKDRARVEAETYANEILPKARGTASQKLLDAEAYKTQVLAQADGESARFDALLTSYTKAPQVTRERLYLETVETVLKRTPKVLVDTKGSGSMLYLPLDKLAEARAQAAAAKAQAATPVTVPEVTVTAPSGDAAGDGRARGSR